MAVSTSRQNGSGCSGCRYFHRYLLVGRSAAELVDQIAIAAVYFHAVKPARDRIGAPPDGNRRQRTLDIRPGERRAAVNSPPSGPGPSSSTTQTLASGASAEEATG